MIKILSYSMVLFKFIYKTYLVPDKLKQSRSITITFEAMPPNLKSQLNL